MYETALPPAVAELIAQFPEAPLIETEYSISADDLTAQIAKQELRQSNGAAIGVVWLDDNTTPLVGRTKLHAGWALPGGTVESGEAYVDAFRREALEEVGVRINASSLRLMALERRAFVDPAQRHTYLYMAVFEADAQPGEKATQTIDATKEGLTIQSFSADRLPETILFGGKDTILQSALNRQREQAVS